MIAINPTGAELAPLSMAQMQATLYGHRRATGADFYAGLGGLTSAFILAGGEMRLACNHSRKAYLAHGANFPGVEHKLGDLSVLDPKCVPRGFANILVAAPECRRHSPACNWKAAVAELSPYDPARGEQERSRATMWCPQRWAAYHRFEHVIIENVVQVTDWNQFGNWVMEWQKLGYNVQAVCLNSAFFFAPQGRDRIAIVATRHGLEIPDLEFRPLAWCWECKEQVYGIQRYKRDAIRRAGPLGPVGKFGPYGQYLYHCPACDLPVSPHVVPAITAIDPSIRAEPIGERKSPLKPKTMGRVERAVRQRGQVTQVITIDTKEGPRTVPAWLPAAPAAPAARPLIVALRRHTRARDAAEPATALCAAGQHHAIVGPDQEGAVARKAGEPCATVTAAGNHFVAQPPLIGANHPNSVARDGQFEPAATVTAGGGGGGLYMIGGGRENNVARPAAEEPAATVTAAHSGGGLYAIGAPDGLLVQVAGHTFERPASGYARAWPLSVPSPTQSTTAERAVIQPPPRDQVGEAVISSYDSDGHNTRDAIDPAATQPTVDRHALPVPAGSTRQRQAHDAQLEPAPTRMPRDTHAVCGDQASASVDVRLWTFRMLVVKEAQALMDLVIRPDGEIYKTIEINDTGESKLTITSTDGVRLSGNAVCQTQWANICDRVFRVAEGRARPRLLV